MNVDPANLVRLVVAGREFGGWKSVRVSAGIERQARTFELEVTDKWPGSGAASQRVVPGDACEVWIGEDLVVTGYVDATPIKYDGRTYSVGVKGRSKTADLVDCCPVVAGALSAPVALWGDVIGPNGSRASVVRPPVQASAQWRGQRLEAIAAALAAPYGVRVFAEVDTGPVIAEHHVQVGETVFESIDRMMRIRYVLSTDTPRGELVFIDVGSGGRAVTALELGKNILSGDAGLDYTGVFSEYICKGQRTGRDDSFGEDAAEEEGTSEADDEEDGSDLSGSEGTARDAMAKRRRVLVIKQHGQADERTCQDRADYERAHRRAKALQTTYTVNGWRQADNSLWIPNQLVAVRDGAIGFNTDMLVAEVEFVLDAQGLRTTIKVGPPDGYRTKAGKVKKRLKGGGSDWSDVR